MPELPEVETTRKALLSCLLNKRIIDCTLRCTQLRVPVNAQFAEQCKGQRISAISRRGKYLLLHLSNQAYILIHLGMSGHFRIVSKELLPGKHDHIDFLIEDGQILRYNDTRRFGLCLYTELKPELHPLLAHLGPEPLSDEFSPAYLYQISRKRKQAIKSFIMNNDVVVGVGNIYASESLFIAGINPLRSPDVLDLSDYDRLVKAIREVLVRALEAGGTTLKDFISPHGKPGYFAFDLQVYGREGQPCLTCSSPIESTRIGGRSSAFCPVCQKLSQS
ncbi:formamidopyrimidine-DNA glycosylase [Legionella birminghamensis]|uniref:Formamidopyrimidine-DNA glycosylase n=1 Tax=Legionella birminghamensis TaxID=28083 RepID=A0A378I715_9GAMM|nr:bifunctional DNA-formamidopyrimidine glycosylase/DNA-(apurinic or apyrimidinic site) lyase [Legionella birminghamensis]KTC72414.1 formamidopyrimidine-DNA glycosylase [Legionella birminghamensis]STX30546.1 formamidopyrimidine-DNA glycosylase [Legionella birminghamensis]